MIKSVQQTVAQAVLELYGNTIEPQVSVPEEQFGDVASNVAMQLAKELGKSPREIAERIAEKLRENSDFSEVSVAGPGFLNIRLTDSAMWVCSNDYLSSDIKLELPNYKGVRYVVEYSCPNWFKELHTGHLYQTILGESIARILESAGADVKRTTFGGDVGLHVARALWSIMGDLSSYEALKSAGNPQEKASFITGHYVKGSKAYEDDENVKAEIRDLNKKIYQLHKNNDSYPEIRDIYFTCRDWSTEYFHYFYELIGIQRDGKDFDKYYPESTTEKTGVESVLAGLDRGIFSKSDGAIVFKGEDFGLHTRVFITKDGLPTYETKDIGVILLEKKDFDFERRVLITGADQLEYMKVVWCALSQMDPSYSGTMTHLTNGIVKFADGTKMSSRLGNVTRGVDVLEAVRRGVEATTQSDEIDTISLGAIKYDFLKYSVGSDIAFDVNTSVSLKGNSGPYLQYAYVRAKSILNKILKQQNGEVYNTHDTLAINEDSKLNESERQLARKLAQFRDVFAEAVEKLSPNVLCMYLYELAQEFNRFYENNHVIDAGGHVNQLRLEMVSRYIGVLSKCFALLGIEAPEQM